MVSMNRAWHAIRSAVLTVTLVITCALPVGADYDAGKRAWEAGKPAEALVQWRAAADAGDRRAMLELGRVHRIGLGAPQDYVLAHMWFNLAASRGDMDALKERDALAGKMTPQQVATAQERARTWRPGTRARKPAPASAGRPASAPSQPATASPPGRAIREAQELLAVLGYKPGTADGRWGTRTAKAYQEFLRDAGLPPGGALTPEGLRTMRAKAKRQRGGSAPGATQAARPQQPVARGPRLDALHRAVQAGDIDGLKAAVKAGADVNKRDGRGWTALMHAANKGYTLMVESLLEAKADPDIRAADGATALFMAAVLGHSEIIELSMKAGADISIRGPKGKTAVEMARAGYGDAEAARRKDEGRGVIALLEGKTLAQVAEEERRKAEEERRRVEEERRRVEEERRRAEEERRRVEEERRRAEEERRRERERKVRLERFKRQWPPGKEFRECDGCPEMVVVPAGTFVMGSPKNDAWRAIDEGPRHEVRIARRFAVGKYEVTFAEWDACVAGGGCVGYRPHDRRWGRGRRPVIHVTWQQAKLYVQWLSQKTGGEYRLLSESEWEYAARAETKGDFHYGPEINTDIANYDGDYTYDGVDRQKTVPVGTFPANKFGLHDVHGNVSEWVEDCWHEDYSRAPSDGSAWTSGDDCENRVLRGGAWPSKPSALRSAKRFRAKAGKLYRDIGFRVARTLTP